MNKKVTKTHYLKLLEQYADAILKGSKTWEVRYNDRNYHAGDYIRFTVIDSKGGHILSKLEKRTYRITYIYSGEIGIYKGYVIMSIKRKRGLL